VDASEHESLLEKYRSELAAAQRQVAYLQKVVDGLTGLSTPMNTGPVTVIVDGNVNFAELTPRQAVLRVLKGSPGISLTPRRIYDELFHRGLVNPGVSSGIAAYDMALRRLSQDPDSMIARDDDTGTYTYRPAPPARTTLPMSSVERARIAERNDQARIEALMRGQAAAANLPTVRASDALAGEYGRIYSQAFTEKHGSKSARELEREQAKRNADRHGGGAKSGRPS